MLNLTNFSLTASQVPVDYGFAPQGPEGSGHDYEELDFPEGSGSLKAGLEQSGDLLKDLAVTTAVETSVKGDDADDALLHMIAAIIGGFVGLCLAVIVISW